MRRHLTNAAYGVVDYASYPLSMLLVAPVVLHSLGAAEYGLWITSTAVISAGGIVASGFCDANIQRIALHRWAGDQKLIADTTVSMLGINLALGTILAVCVWMAAPLAARHMAVSQLTTARECRFCLRAASAGIFLRALESVAVSTHRAFEDYRSTVRISTTCRFVTLEFSPAFCPSWPADGQHTRRDRSAVGSWCLFSVSESSKIRAAHKGAAVVSLRNAGVAQAGRIFVASGTGQHHLWTAGSYHSQFLPWDGCAALMLSVCSSRSRSSASLHLA